MDKYIVPIMLMVGFGVGALVFGLMAVINY